MIWPYTIWKTEVNRFRSNFRTTDWSRWWDRKFWDAQTYQFSLEGTISASAVEGVIYCTYLWEERLKSNYRDTSLVSTAYKILSVLFLSRLIPYAEEITGDNQCEFWPNKSTTDLKIFRKYLRKKNENAVGQWVTVYRLQERYDSAGRDTLFNPYPTAFPYGNGMVLHFYQQQESSTTKTVHKVINKGLKTYV